MKKLIKESLNESSPIIQDGIEWEIQWKDVIDSDPEERMKVYIATGTDAKGKEYQGSAYYYAGILDKIGDIEEV